MNWIKKKKLSTIEAINFNKYSYNKLNNLQQALYQSYNTIQDRLINLQLLDEIPSHQQAKWLLFSKAEFINIINKYNSLSTLNLDHISQSYLKVLVNDNKYLANFTNIANFCINLSYQFFFKKLILIIIPKLNKSFYNISKTIQPIVFLNMIEKFIKKVISVRL